MSITEKDETALQFSQNVQFRVMKKQNKHYLFKNERSNLTQTTKPHVPVADSLINQNQPPDASMEVKQDEVTGLVTLEGKQHQELDNQIHDLADIEDNFSIGLQKILFIISACISAIMYQVGIIIFPININKIREEFGLADHEVAIIMVCQNAGAITGLATTMLADVYGRANMYIGLNVLQMVVISATCQNETKEWHFFNIFMVRFCTQSIECVATVQLQDTIRTNLRYSVVGLMFVVECFGVFGVISLVKGFDENWRYAFICTGALGLLCLILRAFAAESYKWLNRMGRPSDAVKSMNQTCWMQKEPFVTGYVNQLSLKQNQGIIYSRGTSSYYQIKVKEHQSNQKGAGQLKMIEDKDMIEPSTSFVQNMSKAFSKDGPCRLHLFLMLTQTLFSSINFHTIIPYLNDYHNKVSENIMQVDFSHAVQLASIVMTVYTIAFVSVFQKLNKRILLLCVHIQSWFNVVCLTYSSKDIIFQSQVVNLGLIQGGGRIIKILNSCLIAEAAYSNTRSTVTALFNVMEQSAELTNNLVLMSVQHLFPLESINCLIGMQITAIALASCMVQFHSSKSEELPE